MLRAVLIVSSFAMLAATFPAPGPGRSPVESPPPPSFLTLADSADWGPGGAVADMTSAVPQWTSLTESHGPTSPGLPLDTTGWTVVTPASCTKAGFDAAVAAATSCNTVLDVSACSVIETDRTGLGADPAPFKYNPPGCKIGHVLRGNPTTRTILRVR